MCPTTQTDKHTIIKNLIKAVGDDPERSGVIETPQRVVKSWKEIFSGYDQDPKDILAKRFTDVNDYDQMIVLDGIDFMSHCEHHMLPFYGKAKVAYLPSRTQGVVGISKLARLVNCFANRLQIQERMTQQIGQALIDHLDPIGVGVVIKGVHNCMRIRGVKSHNSNMTTSFLSGAFKEDPTVRHEFLSLGDI
tara:strand:- start:346 stop:921 length:576 start_codon:yes stop_codon:yes gene_type:complete